MNLILGGPPVSGQTVRKEQLRALLSAGDLHQLATWYRETPSPLRTLHSILWDQDETVRQQAVAAIGQLTPMLLREDPTQLVAFIRKLFWSMNDESGMLCRPAPEAIAEILLHAPSLRETYLPNLLHFTHEEPFEAGVCRAITRLSMQALTVEECRLLQGSRTDLQALIAHEDEAIRIAAHRALEAIAVLGS